MKYLLILLVLNQDKSVNTNVNSYWDTEYHCQYIGKHYRARFPDKVMGYFCQPAEEAKVKNFSIGDPIENQSGHGG